MLKQFTLICQVVSASLLAAMALMLLIACLGNRTVLEPLDPVTMISMRLLLPVAAVQMLAVATFYLFGQNRNLKPLFLTWMGMNLLAFQTVIFLQTKQVNMSAYFGILQLSFHVPGYAVDWVVKGVTALLIVGGVSSWLSTWAENDGRTKMSCPVCGLRIQFPIERLGQTMPCPQCKIAIKLRKPENLKMSCFFCQGHIAFPAHALGEKIRCPHCKMDITLKESV